MDAARRAMCVEDPFNPLITTTLQASGILVISHFFHLVFKPLGQPGPVAQILAGIVLGPSLLSRIHKVKLFFIPSSSSAYYEVFSSIYRILFMFLIGLEMDIPYLRRNIRKASIVASGGVITCSVFGAVLSICFILIAKIEHHKFLLANAMVILLANTACPIVIRLAAELKFATAEVGRLAICSSIVTEMSCILWFSVILACQTKQKFGRSILFLALTVILVIINKHVSAWCNQRNRDQKYVSNKEVMAFLFVIIALAFLIQENEFSSTISCFVIGLSFPREGKTTRTLLHKLTYAVHNFVLPIYFGYIGFQFNAAYLYDYRNVVSVLVLVFLSIGGKAIGTLIACRYANIPTNESILLATLLNLKGHGELIFMRLLSSEIKEDSWKEQLHGLLIIVVVIDNVIAGPTVAYILRTKEKQFAHRHTSFESHEPGSELRILACVYESRHISANLGLVLALGGSMKTLMTAYVMHLVELPKKRQKKNLMYHQLGDGDQFSDEEDYGGNDVVEINDAVDAFTMETRVLIHQRKIVSSSERMYEDICDGAEDLHASIIFVTFHKHQRLDGKMESSKEGIRTTNQKVLRHAPCSVGIFVDRGQTGFQQPTANFMQNVAVLFFGGPDDREALACGRRIVSHPHVNLTLIRFKPASSTERNKSVEDASSHKNDEILMSISNSEDQDKADNMVVDDFYNRYVATGEGGYMEKIVNSGMQTIEILIGMGETYSLFIVGKGGRGNAPMTTGMSDWEECPELGTVGDLLASSEFNFNSSVLVIQQHRHSSNDIRDD